jgi:zinc protease
MADLLHRTLPAGAGSYDKEEFAALLDGIGAQWKVTDSGFIPYDDYYSTSPRFSFIRIDSVDLYWKESMRLVGLMLSEPRLEQAEIDRAREALMQRVRQDAQSASAVSRAAFNEALYGSDDPRSRPVFGREGSLDDVDQKALKAFALDYLDPGQIVISIVGNVDQEAVINHARQVLGYGAASDHVAAEPLPVRLTTENAHVTPSLEGPQAYIRMGRIVEIDPADRWALEVAVMIASDLMQQDLRETRGWAYSLGISANVGESTAEIRGSRGTRPPLAEQAEAAMLEYFNGGRLEVTDDAIAAAVNSNLGRQRMRRVTSIGRAYNLGYEWYADESLTAINDRSTGLRAVTVDDVARVSEKYFVDGPTVSVVVK